MHKHTLFALAIVAAVALPARAQSLKHERYELDNGMVVILHEDHALPTVSVNLWYRVGARNEPPRRSGFAHLFEHLMFMGTTRVPDNQFDVLMETGGGANNASTSLDRTNYFSWGPSELLPTLLWLDADRLERMGLDMTQAKLDKQRDVVRNELRQVVENAPYQKAYEASYQIMYPPSHPYHNGVIGTHEDLNAARVPDVQDFFATFYCPGNCSLVVAGDFDSAKVRPLIAKLFATLPRGNAPRVETVAPVVMASVSRSTTLDKVQLPRLAISWHSPALYKDGDAECDLLAMVLGDGQSARLYRRLVVKDAVAVDVSCTQDAAMLGSIFRVLVDAKPGADLAAIERTVDDEIARLIKEGPTAEEVAGCVARVELSKVSPLQSVQTRADRLNEYEFYFGEPDSLKRDLDRYRSATPDALRRWCVAVLNPQRRLIQAVLPEQPQPTASARDQSPQVGEAAPFAPAAPEAFTLSNGIKVRLWSKAAEGGGLPLAAATIVFARPRAALDGPAQAGRADVLSEMLSEGTGAMDGPAFAAAMRELGATFRASADVESFSASVSGLGRTFDDAVGLWAQAVRSPRMDESDFSRVKGLHLEDLAQSEEEPPQVAARVAARLLLGDANPYGRPVSGTKASVGQLTLSDVKAAHTELLRPEDATVFIAGDVTKDRAKAILEKALGGWKSAGSSRTEAKVAWETPPSSTLRVAIVDRPGAVQTAIVFAAPGVPITDAKRTKLDMVGTILGGSFTSRLNQNLREDHGYTYGARARFAMSPSAGWFSAASSVRADVTIDSVKEFMKEFARLRAGDISADEATKAAKSMRQSLVQSMGTLSGMLGQGARLGVAGLDWSSLGADLDAARALTAKDLNAAAAENIAIEKGVLVMVGDKAEILRQLAAANLGLPTPFTVDAWGTPIEP